MRKVEQYRLPQGEDWSRNHLLNLELIFQEAKKSLESDLDYFQRLRDRLFTLIRLVIPIVSLLIAFFFKDDILGTPSPAPSMGVWWTLTALTASLLSCTVVMTWNLRSVPLQPKGYEPRFLVRDYFLADTEDYKLDPDQRRVLLLRNMIESYQYSISLNHPKVVRCNKLVNNCIFWIVSSLAIAGAALIFIAS